MSLKKYNIMIMVFFPGGEYVSKIHKEKQIDALAQVFYNNLFFIYIKIQKSVVGPEMYIIIN